MSGPNSVGFKRGYEGEDLYLPSQRRNRNVIPNQHFGVVSPLIVNTYEDLSKNVIWINNEDFEDWFKKKRTVGHSDYYLQIAKKIYQVAIKDWIPRDYIGVTPLQYDEFKEANIVFNEGSQEAVQFATLMRANKANELAAITFEICHHDGYNDIEDAGLATYDLAELRQRVHFLLNYKYATVGQQFLIDLSQGRYKLTVMKQSEFQTDDRKFSPACLISQNTAIEFKIPHNQEITIARQETYDPDLKFNFRVSYENEDLSRTVLLNLDDLKNKINQIFAQKCLCVGDKQILPYQSEILEIFFLGVKGNALPSSHRQYSASYFFDKNPICLTSGCHISFIKNEIYYAKEFAAEVYSVQRKAKAPRNGHFLDSAMIEEALRTYKSTILIGHLVTLNLPDYKIVLDVKNATPVDASHAKESKRWKRQWNLTDDCKITFTTKKNLRWCLVDNLQTKEVKKVNVRISYKTIQTVSLPEKELKEAIRMVLNKGFLKNQPFKVTIGNHTLDLTIDELEFAENQTNKKTYGQIGVLSDQSEICLINKCNNLAITSKTLGWNPVDKLKELGFGGLSEHGKNILEKIVNERVSPLKEEVEKRGNKPTKGIVLYGPPGTGKTLLARNLGKILGCDENHIMLISGTDIYKKFIGESEEHVRKLFAPALEAAQKFKDESEVFLLVIDEIDGILSHRSGDHKWHNSVVTTFLSQMDGLEQFNNIIVVGMTNRLEQIDNAVIRSGRFEEFVEIAPPKVEGRKEILQIYTASMEKKGLLAKDIDFDLLADKTRGYTGADLCALVKKASDHAIKRLQTLVYKGESIEGSPEGLTTMKDFLNALEQMKIEKPNGMSEGAKMMYG